MDEWQNKINIVLLRGYSQHQYAHATGMSQKTVSRIVRGETDGSKYADLINDGLQKIPAKSRRTIPKRPQQNKNVALVPSTKVNIISAQLRAMQNKNVVPPSYRIQEIKSPVRPAAYIPEQAVSLQPGQPLLSQPNSAIEYYASYRPEPWPIGVPVNYLTPAEYKIKLAWGKLKRQ
jgi:transcriptional regulator with XRE-family HTH domain